MTEVDYEALANHLTNPVTQLPPPGHVAGGEAAAAHGRALMMREYGSQDALDRALRPGRTRLGTSPRGHSPTVRGRISDEDYAAFQQLVERTGKKQSELVREAVHLLLTENSIGA